MEVLGALGAAFYPSRATARSAAVPAPASLPQLTISAAAGTSLYLLSPYQHGSVVACHDCEVIVGAVAGALIVANCERVRLTVSCRKLIVHNCVDCEFYIASASPSIVSGDSRHLSFAPHNTSYRSLADHMRLAGLRGLCRADRRGEVASLENHWGTIFDLNSVSDNSNSRSNSSSSSSNSSSYGQSHADAADPSHRPPAPPQSTAHLLAPDKFAWVSVPAPSEQLHSSYSCVALPESFLQAWEAKMAKYSQLQAQMQVMLGSLRAKAVDSSSGSGESGGDSDAPGSPKPAAAASQTGADATEEALGAAISAKFLDWVAASGGGKQLLDLVRIDAVNQMKK